MDCKVQLFNSDCLNESVLRRLKINFHNYKCQQFSSYLKKLYDIDDSETIHIFYKLASKWEPLSSDGTWQFFRDSFNDDSKGVIKMNIYYGNVHLGVDCSVCGFVVVGDRYKCLQCDDFNICQMCFRAKPNVHKEHCFILLRRPSDFKKFLTSIPNPSGNSCSIVIGSLMNRAADLSAMRTEETHHIDSEERNEEVKNGEVGTTNVDNKDPRKGTDSNLENKEAQKEASTKEIDESQGGINTNLEKSIEGDGGAVALASVYLSGRKSLNQDSSIPQEYMDKLPPNIHEGLKTLLAMGFKNIEGPLIALLIEKNGNIVDVIEELEYSLNKK